MGEIAPVKARKYAGAAKQNNKHEPEILGE